MKQFLEADFLLDSETARTLYFDAAEKTPIIDYHCHISPADIAQDRRYANISEVWLGGDHYKWRAMRSNGVPESQITGALREDPFLVFSQWAATLPQLAGNPLYHWSYLELKRYFGISETLNPASARRIYELCNEKLQHPEMSARSLIRRSGVELLCTTDDPADSLDHHRALAADPTFPVRVLPAFRPDKAIQIGQPGFAGYLQKLGEAASRPICRYADLRQALTDRAAAFAALGCKTSDHALEHPVYEPLDERELDRILAAALSGQQPAGREADGFKTALLLDLARSYRELGWVMQIHIGALRNNSSRWHQALGPDTGFDAVADCGGAKPLSRLLDAMEKADSMPRIILYALNPADYETLLSLAGCFQTDGGGVCRVQLGSAWWFNDHRDGMVMQLKAFANIGVLGRFIGMTTDSRSLLSYTRHEYFRRILCNLLGTWAENGELNESLADLSRMVEAICRGNAIRYFCF